MDHSIEIYVFWPTGWCIAQVSHLSTVSNITFLCQKLRILGNNYNGGWIHTRTTIYHQVNLHRWSGKTIQVLETFGWHQSWFSACFQMPRLAGEGAHACTPTTLNELFLLDIFIDKVISSTNTYARAQLPTSKEEPVVWVDILKFFALYYYFGLVSLPSKEDY